jgi:1-acyl-sn-glycerol-3-phosphate acyltransferase
MYLLQRGAEVIKLADRKGFVRIAVETGAPILPVYHFGQSRMLNWHSFKVRGRGPRGRRGGRGGKGHRAEAEGHCASL